MSENSYLNVYVSESRDLMSLEVSFKYTVNLEECLRECPAFDESSSRSGTASGGCGRSFTGSSFSSLFRFYFVDNDFLFLKKKKWPPPLHCSTFSHSLHLKGLNYLAIQSHCGNWWVGEGDRDHDSMSRNKVDFGKDEQDGSHCS